jgi:hypothetical protein
VDAVGTNFLDYAATPRRVGRVHVTVMLCGVLCLHAAAVFLLYRGRVVGHWAIAESDFVVFVVPALCALGGFAGVFAWWARSNIPEDEGWVTFVVVSALVAAFVSFWASVLIPFNLYGT